MEMIRTRWSWRLDSLGSPTAVCCLPTIPCAWSPGEGRQKHWLTKGGSKDFQAVQQLRLHDSTAGAWVQSLVEELRSHMPQGAAKKPKPKQNETKKQKTWGGPGRERVRKLTALLSNTEILLHPWGSWKLRSKAPRWDTQGHRIQPKTQVLSFPELSPWVSTPVHTLQLSDLKPDPGF